MMMMVCDASGNRDPVEEKKSLVHILEEPASTFVGKWGKKSLGHILEEPASTFVGNNTRGENKSFYS